MLSTTDLILDANDSVTVTKRPVVPGLVVRFRGPLGSGEHFNLMLSFGGALDLAQQLAAALAEHGNVVALARVEAVRSQDEGPSAA